MVIQRILRHSNLNVTLAHYVKVRDPRVDAATAQLEAEVTKSDTAVIVRSTFRVFCAVNAQ